jgi:3-hydroxyacyl-CoA dehydrogenase
MAIARDKMLDVVEEQEGALLSISEIADRLDVPENTAKGHFSRPIFRPVKEAARGKKIFDQTTLKLYAIWLYLSPNGGCPLSYSANDRDDFLASADVGALWNALSISEQEFVNQVLSEKSAQT